ncbi:MAG: right-handed parallel beta-helix repeat-containing protein, partial [Nocardioides sp.]|nr:right-handed parallel beta-helix repeat-containing protein [Nocardioides sp.]
MLVLLTGVAAEAAGTTYFVNNGATCSDGNAGTSSSAPLCTITAAAKKAVSGDTVQVAAGSYSEQVTAVASGVTYQGSAQAEVVGSAAVADTAWTQIGTSSWGVQPGWPSSPAQVSSGGTALTRAASAAAVDTTPNSWFWDSSKAPATLLVNAGGTAPSAVTVSWTYGFLVRGLSGVTIDGFAVTGHTGAGINLDTGTSGSTVTNTTVSGSGGYGISDNGGSNNTITGVHTTGNTSIGIRVLNSTGDVVSASTSNNNGFHGVSVQGGSGNTVRDVTAFANLKPGTRVATGIDVSSSSSGVLVERNTVYGNDDSGIEIY